MEEAVGVLSDRLDDRFDRLDTRLSRIEGDIGKGHMERGRLGAEIVEARRDLGELRDRVVSDQARITEAAAKGGAKGVAETVTPVVQSATTGAIKDVARSWPAKVIAVAVAFVALMTALNAIPDAQRAVERVWGFSRDFDDIEGARK